MLGKRYHLLSQTGRLQISQLHNRKDIIGVDANWTLLSRYPGIKIAADISNPPFFANSVDCILLLNVIDSYEAPFVLLQQVDALLKKGGTRKTDTEEEE